MPTRRSVQQKPQKTPAQKKPADLAKPLCPAHQRFVAEYLKDQDGAKAYVRAGYNVKSAAVARAASARLLANVAIRAAIDADLQKINVAAQESTGVTLERTLLEIARGAFFDVRKLFRANGSPKAINELDDETAAVIAGLDVLEEFRGSGEEREFVGYVKKYKLSDRKGYLDMLMKHLGGYKEDNSQKGASATDAVAALMTAIAGASGSRLPFAAPKKAESK